jgi:hypothetical protein
MPPLAGADRGAMWVTTGRSTTSTEMRFFGRTAFVWELLVILLLILCDNVTFSTRFSDMASKFDRTYTVFATFQSDASNVKLNVLGAHNASLTPPEARFSGSTMQICARNSEVIATVMSSASDGFDSRPTE